MAITPPVLWRRRRERYRLIGSKCVKCGHVFFLERKICPNCRRAGELQTVEFSGKGKVFSYTVIRSPPAGFEVYVPYVIGLIELEEGAKVLSQIVDCNPEDVYIGMPVEVCFRKVSEDGKEGIINYSFKFRPLMDYGDKQSNG